jgi:hypothetical protein
VEDLAGLACTLDPRFEALRIGCDRVDDALRNDVAVDIDPHV